MSDPVNKWNQPVAPPPPMFFGKKERDLVKQVNDELAERVIGQEIAYYPISIEESNFNETYGESIDKVSLPPVRVYAYVEVTNEQTNERYGYEYQTKLTVNFHRKRLTADQDLFVRVGDFVQYGTQFYEIVKTYNDTRYYFGQVEHKFQISAECVRARQGTFRVLPAIDRKPDRGVVASETTAPAPRVAPIPPINATYITVTSNAKLSHERVLTAGAGITLTDTGANGTLTVAASGQNAVGPTGSVQFTPGGGTFSGSHSLRFFSATPLLELTGAMRINGELTASAFNLTPRSGSLAGGASYLGLDSTNNLVLTSAAAAATTPAGATTQIQYNNAGVFAGSSNLTFDGTTVTAAGVSSTGNTTLGDASGDSVTINAQTIALTNIAAGTDNTVLVYNGSSVVTDEIDSRVWGSTLVDASGTPVDNQVGIWTDANTMEGSTALTFDGSALNITGEVTASTTISASSFHGDGSSLTGITAGAAGSDTEIQFNNSGVFGASANLTFDGTTVAVTGDISASVNVSASSFYAADKIVSSTDTDTYIDFTSVDEINFWAGGQRLLRLNETTDDEVVVGDGGPVNFRVATAGYGFNFYVKSDNAGGVANSVGIREQSPQAVFHVSGTTESLLTVEGLSGTGILFVTGSGRVGIGTTTPTYALDVAGDAGFNEYIYHNGDTDTFIRLEPDEINIEVGGENMIFMVEGGGGAQPDKVTINNALADIDFQVKGAAEANLIRTDALNDMVGIGTSTPSHLLTVAGSSHLSGGLIHKRTAVVTSYTASVTDYLLGVTAVPTAILLNAAAFTEGQTLVVKDESGAATLSKPVTLNASGVQTIDGASSVTIDSAYGSVLVYTNGSNWFIY